jgi:hypothetical protein
MNMRDNRRGGTNLKGDALKLRASRILGKGRHAWWGRVPLLIISTKKIFNKIFIT